MKHLAEKTRTSPLCAVECIDDATSFDNLREEWNGLLEESAANSIFLTWEWLHTWWKHLCADRRLSIVTVRCAGELLAIAPLAVRPPSLTGLLPFRALEFLGTGSVGSDYLDVIVRRGREHEALDTLGQYLAHGKHILQLSQLKTGPCFAADLAARLNRHGWSLFEEKTQICPYIDLSGHTWESYLASLGRDHRYNFQRRLRNLRARFDVRFEKVLVEHRRQQALGLLGALHEMRWRDRGGSDGLHTRSLLSFHENLTRLALERGWLRLFVLWLDGEAAAALYGFNYCDTFYFYQSGFDPGYGKHSVGLVTMGLAIKDAIEEGAGEYDMLHGNEQYKFHWARNSRELRRLEMYPPRGRGLVYKGGMELSRATRRMARRLLPGVVAGRIKAVIQAGLWKGLYAARSN